MAMNTAADRVLDAQILTEAIKGEFAQKTAFMGSALVSSGAVLVSSSMPHGNQESIGNIITVPYFGLLGDFANNPDGSAVTPQKILGTSEQATVNRSSLAFEATRWARGAALMGMDPYLECGRQAAIAVQREIDKQILNVAKATPLVKDVYSATTPVTLNWDVFSDGMAMFGDDQEAVVAFVTHSQVKNDLRKLKDGNGRPLLVDSVKQGEFTQFMGVPLLTSDRVPLDGSTMGAVTSAGTSPPTLTITGTPTGAFKLKIKVTTGGANATAKIQFSTDGGTTWSADITTGAAAAAFDLIDTAPDSLIGVDGKTGLQVAFASGTFNIDNTWTATANLKVSTLGLQRGACAFWYDGASVGLQTDRDILSDADVAAIHLYYAAHRYRRRNGGKRPGVLAIKHNISGFVG